MINTEVFDLMAGRLGRRQAPLIRQVCVTELNQAIRELERGPNKPWFLEDSAEDDLVANQGYIELPADFLMEIEEGTFELEHEADGWTELTKVARDVLRKNTANCDPAFPEAYSIWGKRFLLGPTPDQAYAYRFDYYKRTESVGDNSSTVTNDWLLEFFDYTTYFALIKVARDHLQNSAKQKEMTDAWLVAKDMYFREIEARKISNETLLLTNEEN